MILSKENTSRIRPKFYKSFETWGTTILLHIECSDSTTDTYFTANKIFKDKRNIGNKENRIEDY